jgi:hypothetical protein
MKNTWVVALVLAGGAFGAYRMSGCLSKEPDQKLASRFDDLCDIAHDGVDDPVRGVNKLGRYLGRHTDDMLGEFGATIATIEKVSDDDAHDRRAHVARERISKPLIECAETWDEFGNAIEGSPEAVEILERGIDRLGRTLEILFGDGATFEVGDIRHLPDFVIDRLAGLDREPSRGVGTSDPGR